MLDQLFLVGFGIEKGFFLAPETLRRKKGHFRYQGLSIRVHGTFLELSREGKDLVSHCFQDIDPFLSLQCHAINATDPPNNYTDVQFPCLQSLHKNHYYIEYL